MEIALLVIAACGLLGCFGTIARLDVTGRRDRFRRPLVRAAVR